MSSGFPTRSDTNKAVQPQKMARSLKFRILEVEEMYNLFSKNKGADQLRSYCAADLRLCFRICEKAGFLMTWLNLCFELSIILSLVTSINQVASPMREIEKQL